MREADTLHVYDLGISGRVHDSQNQLHSDFETPGYLQKSRKINLFEPIVFGNLSISKIGRFGYFVIRNFQFVKRYLFENSESGNWKFGNEQLGH